jgi:transposase
MEASGQAQWFERLLEGLGVELWRGDAEVIRAKRGRKQKTDREDARHILKLLRKDDFPRIWVPSWENRDLRQLLWHRHRNGAGADASHESTAGGGAESRAAL